MTSVCFDALITRVSVNTRSRELRVNYSREQFARIIRVSVKRPLYLLF